MPRTDRPLSAQTLGGRRRTLASAALAILATVSLSGCTLVTTIADGGTGPGDAPTDSSDPSELVDPDLPDDVRSYYEQELDWSSCESDFECAVAAAPIDWEDPSKGEIELAMLKVPAEDEAIGTLFVNPGGPGASGVEIASYAEYMFGADVLRNYDVVGWDPRGVGASTPVECLDDAGMDEFLYPTPDPGFDQLPEDEQIAAIEAEAKAFGEACLENTGPLLEFVDTISTVHDLDMLRAVVGDPKLAYLGFSYGTFIGSQYIDTFPERAGRMVLDGAIDPSLTSFESTLAQQEGFVDATEAYLNDCLGSADCPFTGSYDDAINQIRTTMDQADQALPTNPDGRALTSDVITTAINATMYSESSWPNLSEAFNMYNQSGDTTGFFTLADSYNDRNPDGTYNGNLMEAFLAINCMDAPVETDEAAIIEFNQAYQELNPLAVPGIETVGNPICEQWPFQSRATVEPVSGTGADPVLVVGTTGDPATPYEEAVALADQLESATLVTFEGEGHTAYGMDPCINDIVDSYLVEGVVPDGEPVC